MENKIIILKASSLIPQYFLEKYQSMFVRQKEQGLILLPPGFEYVASIDDNCEVKIIEDVEVVNEPHELDIYIGKEGD